MDQAQFMEDSLEKICGRQPKILRDPFLNTQTQMADSFFMAVLIIICLYCNNENDGIRTLLLLQKVVSSTLQKKHNWNLSDRQVLSISV